MNRKRFLFFFVLALFVFGLRFHGCTSPPEITSSQQLNDSLEYYFTVANDDSTAIPIRRHAADRARVLTEKLPKDSTYVKNVLRVANRYWNIQDYKFSNQLSRKAYRLAKNQHQYVELGKACSYLSDYQDLIQRDDSAFFYMLESKNAYEKLPYIHKNYPLVVKLCAFFKYRNNDYYGTQRLAYQAMMAAKATGDAKYVSDSYVILGLTYSNLGDLDSTAYYYKKARVKGLDSTRVMVLNSDVAILLCEKKQYDEAIRLQKQSLAYAKRHAMQDSCRIMLGLGYILFKSGNLSEGKEMMLKAEHALDSLGTIMHIIENKINLSDYYSYVGDTLTSIRFARAAKEKAGEWRLPVYRLNALRQLLLVDRKNRDLLTNEYLNLSDSLQLAERRNRNKFAQIEFQTSELKEQNQQLLTQNQKIIIGASSVGVLLLGGLFARHYRARKKEVQLLRERQAADDEIFQLLHQQQEKVEEGRKLEKRRISQELHDGVMGKLSGIRLNLFVLNKRNDPETVSKCLGHIDKIQEVEKEIRSIAYDLENDLFGEDHSFSALLRTLVQSAKEVSTTQFHLDLDAAIQWDAIPNTVKIQLYRVLQEALTNIRKYAKAKSVYITLKQRTQHLWVVVTDDGIGFTPSAVQKGLGLTNMETRIRRQGGNLKVKSAQGRGTTLVFTVPTIKNETRLKDE